MNEVYILTVIEESTDEYAEVRNTLYRHIESALGAYNAAVDEARDHADEHYGEVRECDEISTDTYRFFRIFDNADYDSITIEMRSIEIIGDDTDDIYPVL